MIIDAVQCAKHIPLTESRSHVCKRYETHNNSTAMQLPNDGGFMEFNSRTNQLERPCIVYADFECTSVKTDKPGELRTPEQNSATYLRVCTVDSSRKYQWISEERLC